MKTNTRITHDEQQAQAVASIPQGMAVIRMEMETMTALAAAHPRNLEAIKEDLAAVLQAFPLLAEEAVYNKPVGKDERTGQQKYARNLSIRAAEALAECYGFNSVSSDLETVDESTVKITATFCDYQRGRIWRDATIVSKFYRARTGQMIKIADDRFYNVTVKAEKAKAIRETIIRSVNAGLKAWFWDQCEKIVDSMLDQGTVQKILGQFSTRGISQEQLERHLGKPLSAGWTKQDRKDLLGVWNALKDGETTVEEAFGTADHAKKPGASVNATGNGGAKAEDLASPRLSPDQSNPHASAAQAAPDAGSDTATARVTPGTGAAPSEREPGDDTHETIDDDNATNEWRESVIATFSGQIDSSKTIARVRGIQSSLRENMDQLGPHFERLWENAETKIQNLGASARKKS